VNYKRLFYMALTGIMILSILILYQARVIAEQSDAIDWLLHHMILGEGIA
jgi:hypothetical protein